MKLKAGMSVLLAQNPKYVELAQKKYHQKCIMSLDCNDEEENNDGEE